MKRMRLLTGFGLSCLLSLATLVGVAAPRAADQATAPATATAVRPVSAVAAPERPIDFNWDVRPILSDNCFRCHGPDEKNRQAGLRLDTAEGAYAALRRPGTFAIVPGKPAESQLMFRITHANAVVRMPPQITNKVITPQQVEVLRAWIAQGAQYKPHWAFMAPQRVAAPTVPPGPSVLNDIDRFVQGRLDREGLKLSAPADKETLINRVTLTLTGLPPTLAEVDAFLADKSPQAYERLVDRLLASPAYGEHVGGQWLDIARYAESDGFLDDTHDRLLWPYRDWVIAATNKNMPFDQFATWQLAGDLLPSHTKEQLLATAFMRVGKRSTENGAIDEEYRVEYAVDRATTVGTGFLAMTVGCARCHDHKYDPIPTKDFYSLTGFFNSTDEPGFYAPGRSGITPGPTMLWTDEATEKEIAGQRAAIARAEAAYETARKAAAHQAGARADALLSNPAQLKHVLEQSLTRDLQGHYPFEATAPIPDDVQPEPVPQARLSPPPLALESLSPRCYRHVSDVGCQTMRTGMARLVDSW
jgi:cytochrome c553